jgi:hypothetical protein
MDESGARDDLLAGVIFVALGGGFAYTASTYEVGSLRAMGPGYFPLALGLVLAALGVVIMVVGLIRLRREAALAPAPAAVGRLRDAAVAPTSEGAGAPSSAGLAEAGTEDEERGSVPWGRAALILAAIIFFGATIGGLGVVPALLVTVFLAALAGHGTSWRTAALISVGLTALCVLVFVMLLQLRLPLVGPWLGG